MRAAPLLLVLPMLAFACSGSTPGGPDAPPPPAPTTATGSTSPSPVPTSVSPAPTPDAPTVIRVHYPAKGRAITLRGDGDGLSWDRGAAVAASAADTYEYKVAGAITTGFSFKPMLDDAWSKGPNYTALPHATVDVYPRFVQLRGTVDVPYPAFTSKALPSTRKIRVYLPPTYVENTLAKMPVIYMHDGQNLFSPDTAFGGNEWKIDEAMDQGAEDGTIREAIVVGVDNTADRVAELTPTVDPQYGGGKADQYLDMIEKEIVPMVEKDLRVLPGRENRAVAGSSLGGLVSSYAGVHRAATFGLVGSFSPSTWWNGGMILGEVSTLPTRPARPLRVYVDSGDSGPSADDVAETKELANRYRAAGYKDGADLLYVVEAGAVHSEIYWAERAPKALAFLLGPGR